MPTARIIEKRLEMTQSNWHPDYIAHLKTLKGHRLEDFQIRECPEMRQVVGKFYRASLNGEVICGAQTKAEVRQILARELSRAEQIK